MALLGRSSKRFSLVFLGVLIEIPAAFILAFGPRSRLLKFLAPAAVGIGSALMLDEVTYLVATGPPIRITFPAFPSAARLPSFF